MTQPVHPMFYSVMRIFGVLGKFLVVIIKILGITLGMTLFGYSMGFLFEFLPGASVNLNNGFYHLGIDAQFNFAELGMALGFVSGLIVSGVIASIRLFISMPLVKQADKTEVPTKTPIVLDEIALNLESVSPVMEANLDRFGVTSIKQLVDMTVDDLSERLEIPPKFSEMILAEAKALLREIGV